MSVFSAKTGLSSILKSYSTAERDKAKSAAFNKVRFELPKQKGLLSAIEAVNNHGSYDQLFEFVAFITESAMNDDEFVGIFEDARRVSSQLSPKFSSLVEALLRLPWTNRCPTASEAYANFAVDVLVAHNKYLHFGVHELVRKWVPLDVDAPNWINGIPTEQQSLELASVHRLVERILGAIPMAFDVVQEAVEKLFPYYKKAPHVVAGYVHNLLWLIDAKPMFTEFVVQLIFQQFVILDVNAPRTEIEDAEENDIDAEHMGDSEQAIFEMDDCDKLENSELKPMSHPIAQTLDICMEKMFVYLEMKNPNGVEVFEDQRRPKQSLQFVKTLLNAFDNVILTSHNTHHVQFLIFYYCTYGQSVSDAFLQSLWSKVKDPNVSAVIRQAAVGYIASFLARMRTSLPLSVLKHYLKELCGWAHQYIQRCDQNRANGSLKANLVFFSVCQAVFYVIAFRSRDLTQDKKNLLFLQSLHLSALVTSPFNPLRVCLPVVATAFAGVTRAYQLAYCHAILERNARRKLATVYGIETATPTETLDTFFPFDPYLLKISGVRIAPHYLQYQPSSAEEDTNPLASACEIKAASIDVPMAAAVQGALLKQLMSVPAHRKRGDSEMNDDIDDFIIADKRQRFELARSHEREAQFAYGLSPGFQI